jgi:MFS family permease
MALADAATPRIATLDSVNEYPSPARAWYSVVILMLAYILSFIDRQVLNLLVAPVRRDLHISDTQMSLLIGFSFALFYALLGLPFGRLADSRNRPRLIAAGVFTWSLMTGGCGLAASYWQLFFLRMGVGVGEACLSPAAYSLIADSFPPKKRAMPFSVYNMAIYIGSGCAFLFGALLIRSFGSKNMILVPIVGLTRPWQVLFLILGVIGIVFVLALLTLRDPSRKSSHIHDAGGGARAPLGSVLRYLLQNRNTLLCINVGAALVALAAYGATAWDVTFLARNHHLSPHEAGIVYGAAGIIFGPLGMFCAGKLSNALARRGYRDAYVRVAILATAGAILPEVLYPLLPSTMASVALTCLALFFRCIPTCVVPAAMQELVPNAMRGQATALYLLIVTLLGLGIGPTAIALVTDRVFGYDAAVRYSLLIVPVLACVLAWIFLEVGRRTYAATLVSALRWLPEDVRK